MKDEIRKKTCIIIRKNGEYLVGTILGSTDLRWSLYASEAWRTRNRQLAERIAKKVGGILMLYNPIINEARVL